MAVKNAQRRHTPGSTSIIKLFFQILQCLHHLSICKAQSGGLVTKAFKSKLKELNRFMRPAQETTPLREDILAVNQNWMKDMTGVLQAHYSSRISELLDQIKASKLNLESFDQTISSALQWARRNFGSKLKQATIQEFQDLLKSIRPGQSKPQQQQATSSNKQVGKNQYTGKGKAANPLNINVANANNIKVKPTTSKPKTPTPKMPTALVWTSGWDHDNQIRRVRGPLDPLSNFFMFSFFWRGQWHKSVEHAYQWDKAIQHDNMSLAERICRAPTAKAAKFIADESLKANIAPTWASYKLDLMLDLLIHKGRQNTTFFQELLQSVGYRIVHPVGCGFWGQGKDGKGSDHFANLLVKARAILTSDPIDSHVARDTNPVDSHVASDPQPGTSLVTQVPPQVDSHVANVPQPSTSLHAQVPPEAPVTSPVSSQASPLNSTHRSPIPNRGWETQTPVARQTNPVVPGTPAGSTRSRVRRQLASTLSPGDSMPAALSPGDSGPKGILNVHPKTNKANWHIKNVEKPILVIGDSNLARIQAQKSNVQIESFPGGNFSNIRKMLQRSLANKINTTLAQHVIFSVGINDLNNKPHSTSVPELRKVIHLAKDLFPNATVHFAQINFSQELSAYQKNNLREINDFISKLSLCKYIKRLAHPKFRVTDDHIHWTPNTANAFLEHWVGSLAPHF